MAPDVFFSFLVFLGDFANCSKHVVGWLQGLVAIVERYDVIRETTKSSFNQVL